MRFALLLVSVLQAGGAVAQCAVTDFLQLELAGGDPLVVALEAAYPGLDVDGGVVRFPGGAEVPFEAARDIDPAGRLDDATVGDQFYYPYRLAFDLVPRRTPWVDPGRLRNDGFFRALYFGSKAEARRSLEKVTYSGAKVRTGFSVTTKNCVSVQLRAAFDAIQALGPTMDVYFRKTGGSFNWRVIAGTDRLSVHSFGGAVDLNSELGGYWIWSGVKPGQAVEYDNKIPEAVVKAMERFGFIWGGKWHHFDGMHFEYRPELILYSRLTGG